MKTTDESLLEQLGITELDVGNRKALFSFSEADAELLCQHRQAVERNAESLVDQFHAAHVSIPETDILSGYAGTRERLRRFEQRHIVELFGGLYDLEYVNSRLRIGLVLKRLGVDPKVYMSAVNVLRGILEQMLTRAIRQEHERTRTIAALHRLLMFDLSLVFDSYVRGMMIDAEQARDHAELNARGLEQKVRERTALLEKVARNDALTGLLNIRHLSDVLTQALRGAERRREAVTVVFFGIDDFTQVNDRDGHQQGDRVLCAVAMAAKSASRLDDHCFRFGGDEFCVVMTRCTEEQARQIYVPRLLKETAALAPGINLSIGIAQTGPDSYVPSEHLVRVADQKMYEAKRDVKSSRRFRSSVSS